MVAGVNWKTVLSCISCENALFVDRPRSPGAEEFANASPIL